MAYGVLVTSPPPYWLIGPIVLLMLYMYGRYPYYVWPRLGVHGPPPTTFLGNNSELYKPEGAYLAIRRWQKKYGRVFGIYAFRRPMLVVTEPDLLRELLVKDFANFNGRFFFSGGSFLNKEVKSGLFFARGAQWKRIRTIITPAFSSGKLRLLTSHIHRCSQRLRANFRRAALGGELVNVKKVFGAFSMDVIASTAFSLQVDTQSDLEEPLIRHGRGLFNLNSLLKSALLLAGSFPHVFIAFFRKIGFGFFNNDDIDYFDRTIRQMIRDRKGEEANHGDDDENICINDGGKGKRRKRVDILQMLIDAEAEDGDDIEEGSAKVLNSEEIIAQCLVFFIAGYETTSTTLQFLLYELARNPDVQSKLVKEMDSVLGQMSCDNDDDDAKDKAPTYEQLQELKYMEAVIKETLRMYPPLTLITREAERATKLGSTVVPANCGIMIPISNIGRDSTFYKNPDQFDPERFLENSVTTGGSQGSSNGSLSGNHGSGVIDPLTFLSFGYGPRLCVGMRLAMLELRLALVYVLREVKVTASIPHEVGLKDFANLLKPSEPIMVAVEPRMT